MKLRIPPGRAGRLWLRQRLVAARKAADLLEHKRRELEAELQRVQTILAQREAAWNAAAAAAEQWLPRFDAAGARRSLELAVRLEAGAADVQLTWQQVMGVRYPTSYTVAFPAAPPIQSLEGGAALTGARQTYRDALDAAVAHAIAATAARRIRADIDRTIRRLRALQLRAIPAHETALASLELRLDEKDREDVVAARWVVEGAPSASGGAPEGAPGVTSGAAPGAPSGGGSAP